MGSIIQDMTFGRTPSLLIDLHIADLLPTDPKPVRKVTSAYRINNTDIDKLTDIILDTVKETILNLISVSNP